MVGTSGSITYDRLNVSGIEILVGLEKCSLHFVSSLKNIVGKNKL